MNAIDWLYLTVTWPIIIAAIVLNIMAMRRGKR